MKHTSETLLENLRAQGISFTNHHHEPVFTVEESHSVTANLPGAHTKNLFVKDKANRFWLITSEQNRSLSLKSLGKHLGAKERLSFANEDLLWEHLGVKPGSVSPMGLINAKPGSIHFILDQLLAESPLINTHPLQNNQTTALHPNDLQKTLKAWGHETTVMNLGLFPRENT